METTYPILETLRDFVEKAGKLGIEYMVTGSFAMSAYGEIRYTRAFDIFVRLDRKVLPQFVSVFADKYYVNGQTISRAIDRRSMFNVVNLHTGEKLDFIIQKDTEFARMSFGRRRRAVVAGIEFWTTTKEDLIIAKLDWTRDTHSEMQIRDIANLTVDDYDSAYVSGWIESLGLSEIWSEVDNWKTLHQKLDN